MNKAAIFYLSITYLIFLFGPWPYPAAANELLTLFMGLIILTFIVNATLFKNLEFKLSHKDFNEKYCSYIIYLSFISVGLGLIEYFNAYPGVLPSVLAGDLGSAYLYIVGVDNTYRATPFFMFASVLFSAFTYISIGMLFFYDCLSRKIQKLLILFAVIYIIRFLIFGQLKGVIDIVGIFSLYLLRKDNFNITKLIFKPQVIFLSAIFGTIGFLIHASRDYGLEYGTFGAPLYIQTDRPNYEDDSILESFYVFYELIARYFSHGYYALSQSFVINFKPDIISFSLFINDNFRDLNMDSKYSLIKLLGDEYQWDYRKLWHTQFLWWISGFGYAGAILIIFFQQFTLLSLISRVSANNSNFFELGIMGVLLINFLYMPLNNQVFYNLEGVFSILVLSFLALGKIFLQPRLLAHHQKIVQR